MEKIKIGIVGLGRVGMGSHLKSYAERADKFEVYAVCDIIRERADKAAAGFNCKAYTSYEDMLKDPGVEMVDIATRSCDHYIHTKMALLAGKAVICEKPFGCTAAEAEELVALGSQPGGPRLFVRHNRRLESGFTFVNEVIDSGILGDVYEIRLARNGYNRRCDWQTLIEFGGGQLLNWGPHIVDHALRFCGGGYVDMYSCIKRVAAVGDAEDHIKILFTGVNGRIVDMEISNGCAMPVPEYVVYGSKGSLVSLGGNKFKLRYLDPNVKLPKIYANPETPTNGRYGNPEELSWVEEERECGSDVTENIWDCLYDSYRLGKPYPVPLDQALAVTRAIDAVKRGTIFQYGK